MVLVHQGGTPLAVRVCAIRKTAASAENARKKLRHKARKHGHAEPSPEALEAASYFFILTTLEKNEADTEQVLELYRCRWQVELVFKRLKSILGLGNLPKQEPEGARAWLQGKLFVATLVEALITAGENFSPWGYPLHSAPEPLAGDKLHV